MTRQPVTVPTDASFKAVVTLLVEKRVTALPVLDGDGSVVGVVSDADLVLKETAPVAGPDGHLFETPRHRRERRETLGETAAQLMRRHRTRRLPVTEPATGRLVGIVSRYDLPRRVEGVVDVRNHLTYAVDDRYTVARILP